MIIDQEIIIVENYRVPNTSDQLTSILLFTIILMFIFNDYIDVIYPKELEIKDTYATDALKWANYLDLHLAFDEEGKFCIQLYDRRDDFDFPIVNVPYLSCNT